MQDPQATLYACGSVPCGSECPCHSSPCCLWYSWSGNYASIPLIVLQCHALLHDRASRCSRNAIFRSGDSLFSLPCFLSYPCIFLPNYLQFPYLFFLLRLIYSFIHLHSIHLFIHKRLIHLLILFLYSFLYVLCVYLLIYILSFYSVIYVIYLFIYILFLYSSLYIVFIYLLVPLNSSSLF